MGKTKTKKFRGSARHGRGRKGGRGKGLRGGTGNAGLHKHKYASTVIKEAQGIQMFGRRGFKRPTGTVLADVVLNVGDLAQRFPGTTTIDLGAHGVTKLLGAGEAPRGLQVTVEAASEQAIGKVQAAGGKVTTTRAKAAPKAAPAKSGPKAGPSAPPAKAPAPPAPAARPASPQKATPPAA